MVGNEQKSQHAKIIGFQNIADGLEISQRLGHFFIVGVQKTGVHPITNQRRSGDRFHLRDLGFVVRENQIDRAAMDVIMRPEFGFGDGGVFDVPAGPALADLGVPSRFAFFGRFPQAKIIPAALEIAFVDARHAVAFL